MAKATNFKEGNMLVRCARRHWKPASVAALAVLVAGSAAAQDPAKIQIKTTRLSDSIHVLSGQGANITALTGEQGVLLIDDGSPGLVERASRGPFADNIKAAVATISLRPIRIILNTSWHYDHADANEGLAGAGAVVIAHERSRARLLMTDQRVPELDPALRFPIYDGNALPVVTFADALVIRFNGEEISAIHIPSAHSDGDVMYRLSNANVLVTGDLFFPNAIPFINFSGGGTIDGVIRAADLILEGTDANTRIVPGHGPVSTRADVKAYRDLMSTIRDRFAAVIASGKSVDEAVAANPLADLYAGRRSYFKIENLTRYGYLDVKRALDARK
jgi:glyoxylase-like metal-dependent hydrolase (beta-lactamase superfamily II)